VAGETVRQPKSVWSGVYTVAQAKAGEAVYAASCAECHGEELAGIEQAPALVGTAFAQTWNGATLRKLFDQVESMPPDDPKTLTPQQYVDVLAYVLSASGLPAGTSPLAVDRTALAGIVFTSVPPAP
jgi:mono/diheme cytochrome c family protein